jgi:hypothetical protein
MGTNNPKGDVGEGLKLSLVPEKFQSIISQI